mmetsp:Transcript_9273/g.11311  ORF Transcript_9273/g.11311 Transcript_9273/m.11311 type:complete len:282 (-) Transcript_9273:40-885(-)
MAGSYAARISVAQVVCAPSHIVDLGDLVIEGFGEVSFGLDIALDCLERLHALAEARHVLVLRAKLFLREPLHELALLQQVEVQETQTFPEQEVLLAQVRHDRRHFHLRSVAQLFSIGAHVARSRDSSLHVLELAVEHVDFGSLFGGLAEEFWGIACRQIKHDCVRIRQLSVAINQVGNRGEVEGECVLNRGPALHGETGRVALLVHHILIRVFGVLEQVANGVSQAAHLPVAKRDRLVLLVLLLATSGRIVSGRTNHGHILALRLELANIVQTLVLSALCL